VSDMTAVNGETVNVSVGGGGDCASGAKHDAVVPPF